jgi:hypothetical protein
MVCGNDPRQLQVNPRETQPNEMLQPQEFTRPNVDLTLPVER